VIFYINKVEWQQFDKNLTKYLNRKNGIHLKQMELESEITKAISRMSINKVQSAYHSAEYSLTLTA
jgi:hypothetical protein